MDDYLPPTRPLMKSETTNTILLVNSGNEIGPFRAIEESTIAHLTASGDRSDIYAWYSLIGTGGTALGFITCGWIITFLKHDKQWTEIKAYRLVFIIYAAVGLVKLILALLLSSACELDRRPKSAGVTATAPAPAPASGTVGTSTVDSNSGAVADETAPLLGNNAGSSTIQNNKKKDKKKQKSSRFRLLPEISKESRVVLLQLCILFAFDNFASGLAPL